MLLVSLSLLFSAFYHAVDLTEVHVARGCRRFPALRVRYATLARRLLHGLDVAYLALDLLLIVLQLSNLLLYVLRVLLHLLNPVVDYKLLVFGHRHRILELMLRKRRRHLVLMLLRVLSRRFARNGTCSLRAEILYLGLGLLDLVDLLVDARPCRLSKL